MTRRIDPHEEALVISQLRAANPVNSVERETPDQVTSFLLKTMERTDMIQDISQRRGQTDELSRAKRRPMPPWLGFAAGLAIAALIAIPAILLNGGDDPALTNPALEGLAPDQAIMISDTVEAINQESLEDFRSQFASDGRVSFETGLLMPYHEGVEGGQAIPMTDADGFEADFVWGAALDRRVVLRDCVSQDTRIFSCEVSFTLGALRMEWLETLAVALNDSGEIALLATEPLDIDPVDRQQPLGFPGYFEFESWLEETHPDEYRRLVDPGTPGSINGVEIQLSFAPQNPELVSEVTTLIDEYLASR